jgi:hypothetical protein
MRLVAWNAEVPQRTGGSPRLCFAPKVRALPGPFAVHWQRLFARWLPPGG